ncbi:DUF2834 domain-containing protein [Gordonia humi]|uniref:DUF2834 domain-containing protein n=1 Tax=Gordonia humi TaxID=686429 RepID=A0A840ET00_9ACTN|nr:DUF2834 domain-containing protein [Gordonia humi]MBB4134822.1 hypothetical protein [Gordonia humi]
MTPTQIARKPLFYVFLASLFTQNAIGLPYVARNGWRSTADFFVGDVWKTVPGKFAMVDLTFVVIGFHVWALGEARRLGMVRWWLASVVLTFAVGIATATPFFLLAREAAVERQSTEAAVTA